MTPAIPPAATYWSTPEACPIAKLGVGAHHMQTIEVGSSGSRLHARKGSTVTCTATPHSIKSLVRFYILIHCASHISKHAPLRIQLAHRPVHMPEAQRIPRPGHRSARPRQLDLPLGR